MIWNVIFVLFVSGAFGLILGWEYFVGLLLVAALAFFITMAKAKLAENYRKRREK